MARVTVRYWAAAKAATGVSEEEYDAATLAEAVAAAREKHGEALGRVVDRSTFVVDSQPVGGRPHETVALADGAIVDVLPPFAGGAF